ncbi:MAG: alpha/beta fold hydrolase, partial [Actinomycetota bacterium]|nr:alpha/beta fold hydrolase [Actinomycetota bacterium]
MPELIRPSTVLPANRSLITIRTSDGLNLIGEVATPISEITGSLLMLHPNPSGGGMMDSHIYKKAANRLPAMAGIQIIRFNTRGASSEAGTSEGEYDAGKGEKLDVLAAINYCFDELNVKDLYLIGWSFGAELALQYGRDKRIKELIL